MKMRATSTRSKLWIALPVLATATALLAAPAVAKHKKDDRKKKDDVVRFATFNTSLSPSGATALVDQLGGGDDAQGKAIAETIQRVRPEVILLNEFNYDPNGDAIEVFLEEYLRVSQNGQDPIEYDHVFIAPSNTGIPSGQDLDDNGTVGGAVGSFGYANDSFGFGFYPGQFSFVVLSQHDIDEKKIRTFQNFLWKDMPGALLPDDPATVAPADYYSKAELDVFRLSSKNHCDVPIKIGKKTVHFLVSHPTPPVFDGPEDRNGTRNHDEIRFWADYVKGGKTAKYIRDDNGKKGGLGKGDDFVIAGDQNADPFDGDSTDVAILQLLDSKRINKDIDGKRTPESLGGLEAAAQGGNNDAHLGDPVADTSDFGDFGPFGPGNLRVDYVLPSKGLKIEDSGVFWPETTDPLSALVGVTDHRLVWVDVKVKGKKK